MKYFSSIEGCKCICGKKSEICQQSVWCAYPIQKKYFLSLICITDLMVLVLQFVQCAQIANKWIITEVKLPHRVSRHSSKISWCWFNSETSCRLGLLVDNRLRKNFDEIERLICSYAFYKGSHCPQEKNFCSTPQSLCIYTATSGIFSGTSFRTMWWTLHIWAHPLLTTLNQLLTHWHGSQGAAERFFTDALRC